METEREMKNSTEVIIRDMEKGEEFADWFADLLLRNDDETGEDSHREERYLVLSNEIGDWIGGLRYSVQGGVAQLLELGVTPEERHRGHAHRLLEAFENRAIEAGAQRGRVLDGRHPVRGVPAGHRLGAAAGPAAVHRRPDLVPDGKAPYRRSRHQLIRLWTGPRPKRPGPFILRSTPASEMPLRRAATSPRPSWPRAAGTTQSRPSAPKPGRDP